MSQSDVTEFNYFTRVTMWCESGVYILAFACKVSSADSYKESSRFEPRLYVPN